MAEEEREEQWVPRTEIGKKVAAKEITSIDEIFFLGKPILEHQIVDMLLPNLKAETLEMSVTQRMTDCGRKSQFKAIVIVGDGNGHVGIGVGKAEEARPAIISAERDAKRNIISVPLGCGSWECGCGGEHSLPIIVKGKSGSVELTLKPAPKGLGIAANEVVKKVLSIAGVKDAWSFSRGHTETVYNTAMATYDALNSLNRLKLKGSFVKEKDVKKTDSEPSPTEVAKTEKKPKQDEEKNEK
ncbi:MAG: 30S ribosomal protein S5 [Candidatus Micrarchaeia archaeon]